jgi:2-methylcitrate dehydratase PrpD
MKSMHRRGFLRASVIAGAAASAAAQERDVTRRLAAWVVSSRQEDIPRAVRREATRTILNWVGCAVGGSGHEAVDDAIRALKPFSGPPQAAVLGRKERLDVLHASLMNGISSHVFDFDDTHLRTIVHPAGPVAPAILALAEYRPVTGAGFLHALIVGVEVECRIANAVYPQHYDVGWHITGTVGPFGGAAAAGKLLGLSEQQMIWALGLAASQPVGLREMFGTMTKSFHAGRAAQNGLAAAFLAAQNYTSSEQPIEAPRGWANVLSTARNYAEITDDLGGRFEILSNSYKPFPCGVVIHPALDGRLQLRAQHKVAPSEIRQIDLRVHPLVLELTGKKAPGSGLEGKFSIYRGGRGHGSRAGGRVRIQRRGGARSRHHRTARARHGCGRQDGGRGPGADHDCTPRRPQVGEIRRARHRQRQESDDRCTARGQVPRAGGRRAAARPGQTAVRSVLEDRGGARRR